MANEKVVTLDNLSTFKDNCDETYLTSHLYRPIRVNGTQLLSNSNSNYVNFVAGSNITLSGSGTNITINASSGGNDYVFDYSGNTFGDCYAIDSPNSTYSLQIGDAGFSIDTGDTGESGSNILTVNTNGLYYGPSGLSWSGGGSDISYSSGALFSVTSSDIQYNGASLIDGRITEITTQYIRITSLTAGIYKLTYNGSKSIYYDGSTSTSAYSIPNSTGTVILIVNKYSTTYWNWYCFTGSNAIGYNYLAYGTTSASSGSYLTGNLSNIPSTAALSKAYVLRGATSSTTSADWDFMPYQIQGRYSSGTTIYLNTNAAGTSSLPYPACYLAIPYTTGTTAMTIGSSSSSTVAYYNFAFIYVQNATTMYVMGGAAVSTTSSATTNLRKIHYTTLSNYALYVNGLVLIRLY